MSNYITGPKYISQFNTIYTVAPLGSIICKAVGGTSWLPSAMSRIEFDWWIKTGKLTKI